MESWHTRLTRPRPAERWGDASDCSNGQHELTQGSDAMPNSGVVLVISVVVLIIVAAVAAALRHLRK